MTEAIKEFGEAFPGLLRPLLEERDEFMVFIFASIGYAVGSHLVMPRVANRQQSQGPGIRRRMHNAEECMVNIEAPDLLCGTLHLKHIEPGNRASRVVAVVGAGHLPGMRAKWDQEIDIEENYVHARKAQSALKVLGSDCRCNCRRRIADDPYLSVPKAIA